MRLFITGLLLLGSAAPLFHSAGADAAQITEFPYEAAVDADTVFVHSGPGKNYYATSRLSQGERVVVHRHDPGGWYMIAPPAGSFSWIRADAVDRTSGQRGVLRDTNVVVRVGSALEEARDVFQTKLSTGATVEILGEQVVRTEQGPVQMLKIVPPRGEWRWVPGRAVTPVDHSVRRQLDDDPYEIPSNARREHRLKTIDGVPISQREEFGDGDAPPPEGRRGRRREYDNDADYIDRPLIRSRDDDAPPPELHDTDDPHHRRGPELESLRLDRDRLRRLDDEFRAIIQHDTSHWDFTDLKHGYLHLRDNAVSPALASQVNVRLASLERYEEIKHNYDEFLHLTAKVSRRDARLMALQQEQANALDGQAAADHPAYPAGSIVADPVPYPHGGHAAPAPEGPAPIEIHGPAYPQGPQFAPPLVPQSHSVTAPQVIQQTGHFVQHPGQYGPAPRRFVSPQGQFVSPQGQVVPPQGPVVPAQGQFIQRPGPVLQQPGNFVHPHPHQPGAAFPAPIPGFPISGMTRGFTRGSRQPMEAPGPQFNGAGIIQRSISQNRQAPPHVLLDPNGRILAYLEGASGVDLDQHVGRPMGIRGARVQRPGLQTSVFVVQSVSPVNLQ